MKKFLHNKYVSFTLYFLISLGLFLCISPFDTSFLQPLSKYAGVLVFVYIGLGLVFMILDHTRLLLYSFFAAALISFVQKNLNGEYIYFSDKKEHTSIDIQPSDIRIIKNKKGAILLDSNPIRLELFNK